MARIHIGTSGWHYAHWSGSFYPGDLGKESYLQYYQNVFQTVEVNNTFYRLPEKKTLGSWKKTVGDGFLFSLKASRTITHLKKLKNSEDPVSKFLERAEVMEDKLGPVLFQLPPRWHADLERLAAFFDGLPDDFRYVFEFRDPSWFQKKVTDLLTERGAAFCITDYDGRLSPKAVTADFVYIRLHGPDGPYKGQYSKSSLSGWAGAISAWSRKNLDVFCYFDNDQRGYAPQDARKLKKMMGKE